jgi:hypothetical protein
LESALWDKHLLLTCCINYRRYAALHKR